MHEETGNPKGIGGKILKWIGIITAVVSLFLGIRQVVTIVHDNSVRKQKAGGLAKEAQQYSSSGLYSEAWQSVSQAAELEPDYRALQVQIAMTWLRNIRISSERGEHSFTEIVEKLLPFLFREIDSTRRTYSATVLAHIGWANYLMFREGDRRVDVDRQFTNALALDSTNSYAHAMYAFWIIYPGHPGGTIESANQHFAMALKYTKDTSYVRQLMLSAYGNASGPEYQLQLIGLANEMRKNHELLPVSERDRILWEVYSGYHERIIQEAGRMITPKEHLETFAYLVQGIDMDAKPYLRVVQAKLTKEAGG